MPITLPGHELQLALTGMRKVVAKKPSLPVLSHVRLLRPTGQPVTLTGTDLDTTLTYTFEAVDADASAVDCLLPLEALLRLVKSAQRDRVTLTPLSGSDRLEVLLDGPLGQRTHFLTTLPVEEYPELPSALPVQDCGRDFLPAYQQAAPFASTDETRYVLNSIRVDVEESGKPCLVSTDGRRLCALSVPSFPLETSVTLPLLKFLLWNKLEPACALGCGENRFQIQTGPWTLQGRLIDGVFPNWRQVVPAQGGADSFTLVEADMLALKEAVQTLPIRFPESSEAPLLIREVGGQLELSAKDEQGNLTVRLLPHCPVSTGLLVSVNRQKLLEAVETGFTCWSLNGSMSPLVSRNGLNLHVLMPLRMDAVEPAVETDAGTRAEAPPVPIPETPTEEEPMPDDIKPPLTLTRPAEPQVDPMDELIRKAEEARVHLRDLNNSLRDIIALAKTQKRQERGIRSELQNARTVLEKLRDIAA
jgi:DNA polymerase-3 subunit beta